MRLDKFLKNSRLIKRRTVAKEACDGGRVSVNGRTAKPGTELGIGDVIRISFGNGSVTARVVRLAESIRKNEAQEMYEILNEERDKGQ